jgi:hypothetical protein
LFSDDDFQDRSPVPWFSSLRAAKGLVEPLVPQICFFHAGHVFPFLAIAVK